ncbi:MAG: (d)CMP kinase [Flavobacteriaceae bacterium]
MRKITIAIDGHSSTGKSTVARQLASYLDYLYVDSGAMYRAITLFAIREGLFSEDTFEQKKLIELLSGIKLGFKHNAESGKAHIYLNEIDVEREIRSLEVSQFVSKVAEVSEVRKKLVELQQELGKGKGVVMDGRDIGTVVFPDAELKIFLTADAEERAKRRYLEYKNRGEDISLESVFQNVVERDHIDTTREDSPLIKAKDAIEIDNTFTNEEDQFHIILQLAKDRIAGRV